MKPCEVNARQLFFFESITSFWINLKFPNAIIRRQLYKLGVERSRNVATNENDMGSLPTQYDFILARLRPTYMRYDLSILITDAPSRRGRMVMGSPVKGFLAGLGSTRSKSGRWVTKSHHPSYVIGGPPGLVRIKPKNSMWPSVIPGEAC